MALGAVMIIALVIAIVEGRDGRYDRIHVFHNNLIQQQAFEIPLTCMPLLAS